MEEEGKEEEEGEGEAKGEVQARDGMRVRSGRERVVKRMLYREGDDESDSD